MNINYIQELYDAINNSNEQLVQIEDKLDQAKIAAKLTLHYAQENAGKNEANLTTAKVINDKSLSANTKSAEGVSFANNALTAAKQSLVDAGSATSNVSTAANNIQIAANAITKVASDTAGLLAVANAADQGSKIQESVEKANDKIKKAAEMAEKLSLISLQATMEAAQATVSTVVTDAERALAAMTSLQTATSSQSDHSSEQVKTAHAGLMVALKMAKSASAAYALALGKDQAMKSTRELINQVSNQLTKSNQGNSETSSVDLAAQKATAINKLMMLVEDDKRSLAEAEADYESFEAKSELLDALLNSAIARLTVMTNQNNLAVEASQKVNLLLQTIKIANQMAKKTYSDTHNILISVQQVVDTTLSAATDMTLSAELIIKRKASNPLIASELVVQASQAATNASKAVSLIINALTSSFNALSSANQANSTLEVVLKEVEQLKGLLEGTTASLLNPTEDKMPIEPQINSYYTEAISAKEEAQKASNAVQESVIHAKDKLTLATTKFSNAEASLSAAEAAVGS
jgi:hypothetical protein